MLDDLTARNNRPLTPQEQKREQELYAKQTEFNKRIELLLGRKNPSAKQRQEAEKLGRERDQVQADLMEFQAKMQAKYGVTEGQVYDLARIQNALSPQAALIAWLDGKSNPKAADPNGEHWACLVCKHGSPTWIKLAGGGPGGRWTDVDDELADKVRKALRGRGTLRRGMELVPNLDAPAEIDYPGDRLAQQRLAPVAAYLARHHREVRHLVVLPSRQMAAIPIETLTNRYSISYAPSGTMFAWLQERKAVVGSDPQAANLLALGDPSFVHVAARPLTPPPAPPDHGVLVNRVAPGSSSDKAGIHADDVLLTYAGVRLNKNQELLDAIKQHASDDAAGTIAVQVWRDGKQLEVQVRPGRLGVYFPNDPAPVAIAARRSADELLRRTLRSDRFVPLPGTRREVEAISRLFVEQGNVEALLGVDANEERLDRLVKGKKLETFRYIHLATHAKPDPRGGLQSFLALAPVANTSAVPDGFALPYGRLTAEQILRDWKMDADLVTLSACETGLGKQSGGEGYVGFAQALFLAGAEPGGEPVASG